jgi:hypothetical protein
VKLAFLDTNIVEVNDSTQIFGRLPLFIITSYRARQLSPTGMLVLVYGIQGP